MTKTGEQSKMGLWMNQDDAGESRGILEMLDHMILKTDKLLLMNMVNQGIQMAACQNMLNS